MADMVQLTAAIVTTINRLVIEQGTTRGISEFF